MILVTGSLAFDLIMDFPGKFADHILPDKLHILNVSFLVEKLRKGYGGTAGNIAYTLSLLGIKPTILALVGKDFTTYRRFLEKSGVDTRYVKTLGRYFTSTAFGITDLHDNQIWGFYEGADSKSDKLSIGKIKEKVDFGVIAPNNPKAMLKFAKEFEKLNIPYLFDPGMQLRYFSGADLKKAFKGAKIIIGNDYEISIMEKKTGINNLHLLSALEKIVITTLGGKGSQISYLKKKYIIKPAKVASAQDPAGAGDAYRGGFIAGFLRKFPLEVCGKMGSLAAAYTVEKYGTTTHNYSTADFEYRYFHAFGEKIKLSKL